TLLALDGVGVTGAVLAGRGDTERAGRTRGLKPTDVRGAQCSGQNRFLGPRLVRAAPPVVAREVLHRGEVPHPTGGPQRLSGSSTAGFSGRWIPRSDPADRLAVTRRRP